MPNFGFQFSISLLVLFLAEAGCAVLTYMHAARVHSDLYATLNSTMMSGYAVDDDITLATDKLQAQVCAGVPA